MLVNDQKTTLSRLIGHAKLLQSNASIPGNDIPAMITSHERNALFQFAKEIYRYGCSDNSVIVDAGTFLGSSATALAAGLELSPIPQNQQDGRIWCYDLFRATPAMAAETGYGLGKKGIAAGESFRSLFDEYTRHITRKLNVFEGDIQEKPSPSQPISILFLDILWSTEVSQNVTRRFYPKLQQQRSILIHQDFIYPFYPWIPIHMGLMDKFFVPSLNVPHSSMVFDVIRPIQEQDVPDIRNVDFLEGKTQLEKFINIQEGWGRGALLISLALYAATKSKFDYAFKCMDEVTQRFSNEPLVAQYFSAANNFCKACAEAASPLELKGGA